MRLETLQNLDINSAASSERVTGFIVTGVVLLCDLGLKSCRSLTCMHQLLLFEVKHCFSCLQNIKLHLVLEADSHWQDIASCQPLRPNGAATDKFSIDSIFVGKYADVPDLVENFEEAAK